ncbi:MAG: enoyl-CoA hydratase-related protein [Cycloclasticus sp.]|jgi:short chain enoyl-CoA hydratase (EC 4.2.1.17)|nr:enoyl-CoA hydratase [Cycloclasticus sp. 46_83_sub15_T18]
MTFETILLETPIEGVALIRLNRPRQYNALNSTLLGELGDALAQLEKDDAIGSVVITGSDKAFAAGADIAEMMGKSGKEMLDMIQSVTGWKAISEFSKPTICSVSGMALGGGFELALQCDILLAATGAKFALPEVNLGVIPGAGGTQRVARLVGKSMAMEMVMNARPMLAEEALQRGVVSRVIEPEKIEAEAVALAKQIADRAKLAVRAGKNCVNKAIMSTLEEGLEFEQQAFFPLFDSDDAKNLMDAFLNKSK